MKSTKINKKHKCLHYLQASYTVSLMRFLNSNNLVSSFWILKGNRFSKLYPVFFVIAFEKNDVRVCTCLLALDKILSGCKSLLAQLRSSPCPRYPRERPGSHSRSSEGLHSWWNVSLGSLASHSGTCVCLEPSASTGRTSTAETWEPPYELSFTLNWNLAKVPMSTICW